jgi:DNA-binding SARP family transcriptional activator
LGGLSIENSSAIGDASAHRRPLALLALLAVAGHSGLSRDKIVALLWPESDAEHGRNSLSQVISLLRRELGVDDIVVGAAELRVNTGVLACDVMEFEQRMAAGDLEVAVGLYRGPFLDGVFLKNTPEFERWVDQERSRLQHVQGDALERLATLATARADHVSAVRWWRQRVTLVPADSRATLKLMEASVASGDPAGALEHYRIHHALLRDDLGLEPDATLSDFAAAVRGGSGHLIRSEVMPALVGSRNNASVPRVIDALSDDIVAPSRPDQQHLQDASLLQDRRWRVSGTRRQSWMVAAGAALILVAVALALRPRASPGVDPSLVAVAPFRISGAESDLAYLREGMLDLLAVRLTGDFGPQAMEPRTVLNAWRRALPATASDLSQHEALAVAASLGAGRLLLGGIVGTRRQLTLTASLLAIPGGAVRAEASVDGPQDSLSILVDRLTAQLMIREAGEASRPAWFIQTPLPVIQAYLAGRAAYRQSRNEEAATRFEEALAIDSTFAPAALGLAAAAWWPPKLGGKMQGARTLAWIGRDRLSRSERNLLTAMLPSGYPKRQTGTETAGATLARWRQALAAYPNQPEPWYQVGVNLHHWGPTLGESRSLDAAALALRHALELDSMYMPALVDLAILMSNVGDTAKFRRYAAQIFARDSSSEYAVVRWDLAYGMADSGALAAMRASFEQWSTTNLATIVALGLARGVYLDDVDRAASILRRRLPAGEEGLIIQNLHVLELNRGQQRAFRELEFGRFSADLVSPGTITDALYWDGDTAAAAEAARDLSRANEKPLTNSDPEIAVGARCLLEQWRLHKGQAMTAGNLITKLRARMASVDPETIDPATPLCVEMLEALLAATERRADAGTALDRFEARVVRDGQFYGRPGSVRQWVYAANLVVARLRGARSEYARAVAAARRRSYSTLFEPVFLSSLLREEGRYAALAGDSAGAIRAYRHYLALRANPEPRLAGEVARVRAELDRLEHLRR